MIAQAVEVVSAAITGSTAAPGVIRTITAQEVSVGDRMGGLNEDRPGKVGLRHELTTCLVLCDTDRVIAVIMIIGKSLYWCCMLCIEMAVVVEYLMTSQNPIDEEARSCN